MPAPVCGRTRNRRWCAEGGSAGGCVATVVAVIVVVAAPLVQARVVVRERVVVASSRA